jgi:hypothetical protein
VIKPIVDGTDVTLYYWNNCWHINTAKSWDCSMLHWMSKMTYAELLVSLWLQINPVEAKQLGICLDDGRFSCNLPTSHCYNIGFHHKDFHPLDSEPDALWFRGSTNLSLIEPGANYTGLPDIGRLVGSYTLKDLRMMQSCPVTGHGYFPVNFYGWIVYDRNVSWVIPAPLLITLRSLIYSYVGSMDIKLMHAVLDGKMQQLLALFPSRTDLILKMDRLVSQVSDSIAAGGLMDTRILEIARTGGMRWRSPELAGLYLALLYSC